MIEQSSTLRGTVLGHGKSGCASFLIALPERSHFSSSAGRRVELRFIQVGRRTGLGGSLQLLPFSHVSYFFSFSSINMDE